MYPQAPVLRDIGDPEVVWLSPEAGSIAAGPADERMVVRDAIDKQDHYAPPYLPPYRGRLHDPAEAAADGHFDHLHPDSAQFEAAHMYAVIRRVLDVWETYLGQRIDWHFADLYERLELIPHVDWQNAQSGFGYIEAGYQRSADGNRSQHCLNFDVLAHELGHSIIYSLVGSPFLDTETVEYFGFQEAAADIAALVAVLHFDSVVDRLLMQTSGNLYALNELSRVAELAENEQIRVASNIWRMSDFAAGFEKEHHLSQPLTGALFDVLVGVFHELLEERGLIDASLSAASAASILDDPGGLQVNELQYAFDAAYACHHSAFREALLDARDYLGQVLADSWWHLSAHHLTYTDVGLALLDSDEEQAGGRFNHLIRECFDWREIGQVAPGPRLGADEGNSARSCR